MIYNHTFKTVCGHAAILYKKDPLQLVEVMLPKKKKNELHAKTGGKYRVSNGKDRQILDLALTIQNYFKTGKIDIPWELIRFDRFTPLQEKVYRAVAAIPVGTTMSYGQIAEKVGRPGAARFVGTTMANNPYPIFIPCHRVIKSCGTIGQFGGGTWLKQKMLDLEKQG